MRRESYHKVTNKIPPPLLLSPLLKYSKTLSSFYAPNLYLPLLVFPTTRCKLKLLKLERIKDYLLMEEEFVQNQERLKPQEEKTQASYCLRDKGRWWWEICFCFEISI